jgi:hypothetical protein
MRFDILFGHCKLGCHLYHILIHVLVLPFIHFNILVSVMLASLTFCFLISQHFIQSQGKIVLLVCLSTRHCYPSATPEVVSPYPFHSRLSYSYFVNVPIGMPAHT